MSANEDKILTDFAQKLSPRRKLKVIRRADFEGLETIEIYQLIGEHLSKARAPKLRADVLQERFDVVKHIIEGSEYEHS